MFLMYGVRNALANCLIDFGVISSPGTLPLSKETIKGNIKTITEYKIDEDGKKFKVFEFVIYTLILDCMP